MEQEKEMPGFLKTSISVDLNTRQATKLFYGQEGDKKEGKPEITGLFKFAEKIKQVTYGAHTDDPYADYFLLEIEKSLSDARAKINTIHEQITQYSDRTLLKIDQGSSIKPVKFNTSFASVYANMALDLLKLADNTIMEILAIKHIGFLETEQANTMIGTIERIMRCVFLSTKNYRYTQICRKDVIERNAKYRTAHTSMKFTQELSSEILDRNSGYRAKHAPNIQLNFDLDNFKRTGPVRRRKIPVKTPTNNDKQQNA